MYELNENYREMYLNAVGKLAGYIRDNNIQSLVIGISGGVDSALVAALAKAATEYPYKAVPVFGRSITIESNKREEIERAREIGKYFCHDFKELDLTNVYMNLIGGPSCLEIDTDMRITPLEVKIALGNLKARIRMMQLYHLAGVNKGMVLSTDNYTELLLGFWTLHGDVGDYGMVQNLWKTEVYGLTEFIADLYNQTEFFSHADALMQCVNAVPTDGLGITDSDLDQLGAKSYDEVDKILIEHLNNKLSHDFSLKDHPVVQRYERTHFKRDNPYNIPREELLG